MVKHIHRKYFEIWGEEKSQNSILKGVLLFSIVINIVLTISITILSSKKPFIVSIKNHKTRTLEITKNIPKKFIEKEVKNTIANFIHLRHNFSYKDIDKKIMKASRLVLRSTRSRFIKKNEAQLKAIKKKKIIQRFYLSRPIFVDLRKKEVIVKGDRILIVESLRATEAMTFKLNYTFGSRNTRNLEGVYITKETLLSSLRH